MHLDHVGPVEAKAGRLLAVVLARLQNGPELGLVLGRELAMLLVEALHSIGYLVEAGQAALADLILVWDEHLEWNLHLQLFAEPSM